MATTVPKYPRTQPLISIVAENLITRPTCPSLGYIRNEHVNQNDIYIHPLQTENENKETRREKEKHGRRKNEKERNNENHVERKNERRKKRKWERERERETE